MLGTSICIIGVSNAQSVAGIIQQWINTTMFGGRFMYFKLQMVGFQIVNMNEIIGKISAEKARNVRTVTVFCTMEGNWLIPGPRLPDKHIHLGVQRNIEGHIHNLVTVFGNFIKKVSEVSTYSLYFPLLPRTGRRDCPDCLNSGFFMDAIDKYLSNLESRLVEFCLNNLYFMKRKVFYSTLLELSLSNYYDRQRVLGIDECNEKMQNLQANPDLLRYWFMQEATLNTNEEVLLAGLGLLELHTPLLASDGVHFQHNTVKGVANVITSTIFCQVVGRKEWKELPYQPVKKKVDQSKWIVQKVVRKNNRQAREIYLGK